MSAKGTAIGNHLKDQHNMSSNDIARNSKILRKCLNKLDCLIFEMLFIKELKPTLNKQCDSFRAKLALTYFIAFYGSLYSYLLNYF